jgi:tetratricopeptide (TPR) repeat protein
MLINLKLKGFILLLLAYLSTQGEIYGQSFQDFKASNNLDDKCRMAEELALHYVVTDTDSVKVVGEHLLSYSNKKYSKKGINTSYFIIGNALIRSAKEQKGLELLRQAKNYYLSIEDFDKVTEIYNEIGNGYQYLGNSKEAVKWYKQSLVYGELATDEHVTYMAKINLAQALSTLEEYDEAIEYAEQYRDWVLKLGSLKSSTNAYAVLGSIALDQAKHKKAIKYFEQCFQFAVKAGDNSGQGHAYTNIAISKYLEGDLVESENYFKQAVEFRKKVNNPSLVCDAYLNYGGILFERNKTKEAIDVYNLGLKVAQKSKKYRHEIELLEALKEAYAIYDLEQVGDINSQIEKAKTHQTKIDSKQSRIDQLLTSELKESDRIRKSGFVNEAERFPFYIGAIILFLGFVILAVRRNNN